MVRKDVPRPDRALGGEESGAASSSGMLWGMPEMTSVKVSVEVRDRLALAAGVRGVTVRALLDEFSRRAADEALMERAAAEMARLREADPAAWAGYVDEGDSWERGTVEPFDA